MGGREGEMTVMGMFNNNPMTPQYLKKQSDVILRNYVSRRSIVSRRTMVRNYVSRRSIVSRRTMVRNYVRRDVDILSE